LHTLLVAVSRRYPLFVAAQRAIKHRQPHAHWHGWLCNIHGNVQGKVRARLAVKLPPPPVKQQRFCRQPQPPSMKVQPIFGIQTRLGTRALWPWQAFKPHKRQIIALGIDAKQPKLHHQRLLPVGITRHRHC
jgi:hypothetical protein